MKFNIKYHLRAHLQNLPPQKITNLKYIYLTPNSSTLHKLCHNTNLRNRAVFLKTRIQNKGEEWRETEQTRTHGGRGRGRGLMYLISIMLDALVSTALVLFLRWACNNRKEIKKNKTCRNGWKQQLMKYVHSLSLSLSLSMGILWAFIKVFISSEIAQIVLI